MAVDDAVVVGNVPLVVVASTGGVVVATGMIGIVEVAVGVVVVAVDVPVATDIPVPPIAEGMENDWSSELQPCPEAATTAYPVLQMRVSGETDTGCTAPSDCCDAAIASIGTKPAELAHEIA